MPEHPEIRAFVNFINVATENITFTKVIQFACDEQKPKLSIDFPFQLLADQRGKQLRFTLTKQQQTQQGQSQYERDSPNTSMISNYITIGLGLTGYFELTSQRSNKAILAFQSENFFLNLQSETPESVYFSNGDYDYYRSPDPIQEYDDFLKRLSSVQSVKQSKYGNVLLAEFLMNQKFFNGVGNYLRCELMHRLDYDVETKVCDVDLESVGIEVVALLEEAYEVTSDYEQFNEWLQCYGKASNCVQLGGRSFWTWKPVRGQRVYQFDKQRDQTYVQERVMHVQKFLLALTCH